MSGFLGKALPLSKPGFEAACTRNGIGAATLWSVLAVETSGCGFLPNRMPKILFERHIFSQMTGGKHDRLYPDISSPRAGGHGPAGAYQYKRLEAAMTLNPEAAKQSASWGLGQIMGFNHAAAGFDDVDGMIAEMAASEDGQLKAMAEFIAKEGMGASLRERNWTQFARRYNGEAFAKNKYDEKLKACFEKFSKTGLPDLTVRAAQVHLLYAGYNPGPVDGIRGQGTVTAVKEFQRRNKLAVTGTIDEQLVAALAAGEAGPSA
jgi:N-acetylmuramidase/Putative peptidoglycan binding domain